MFGLFNSRSRRPAASFRRASLQVEALESRYCPAKVSALTLAVKPESGTNVLLSGTLNDPQPSNVQVNFGGVVNASAYTDSTGFFSLLTPANGLGDVTASTQPSDCKTPINADVLLTSTGPTITNLAVVYGTNCSVTISGQVNDVSPGGLSVTFSGVTNGTTTTNVDGTFSATLTASQLGQITVSVTNNWGVSAQNAAVSLASNGPTIQSFDVSHGDGNIWWLEGTVNDTSDQAVRLTFSGMAGLAGASTTTDADGNFELGIWLAPTGNTVITAIATDCWGMQDSMQDLLVT